MALVPLAELTATARSGLPPSGRECPTWLGASMTNSVAQNITAGSTPVEFGVLNEDDGGWWSAGDPHRFTVPVGVSSVVVTAVVRFTGGFGAQDLVGWLLTRNGVGVPFQQEMALPQFVFYGVTIQSTVIDVRPGDVFGLDVDVALLTPASFPISVTPETDFGIEAYTC